MGRHAAMKSAPPVEQPVPISDATWGVGTDRREQCTTSPAHTVEPPDAGWADIDDVHRDRADTLAAQERALPPSPYAEQAVAVAIGLWVRTPAQAPAADRDAVTALATVLQLDADDRGHLDPEKALMPREIERMLAMNPRGWAPVSIPTYRAYLTAAGRVVHPVMFPPLRCRSLLEIRQLSVSAGAVKGATFRIASREDQVNAYSCAQRDGTFARRALVMLDLVTGAGLRAAELRRLRYGDITEQHLPGGVVVAVVAVTVPSGRERRVPIVDEGKALRLMRSRDGQRADAFVLAPDGVHVERNAVNRLSERFVERGYPPIDFEALRNRWVVDIASRVPAAILTALADISRDDLQRLMRAFEVVDDLEVLSGYLRAVQP